MTNGKVIKRLISSELDKISPIKNAATVADTVFMHKVSVSFFGSIRAAAGKGSEEIEVASSCGLYEFLRLLSHNYGEEFKYEIFLQTGDRLRDDLIVSINGTITEHKKLEDIQLTDGAVIALLPNFSGGG